MGQTAIEIQSSEAVAKIRRSRIYFAFPGWQRALVEAAVFHADKQRVLLVKAHQRLFLFAWVPDNETTIAFYLILIIYRAVSQIPAARNMAQQSASHSRRAQRFGILCYGGHFRAHSTHVVHDKG